MAAKKIIAINGFGRIGRQVYRALQLLPEGKNFLVKYINDLADPALLRHLLKYDSVYGRFEDEIPEGVVFTAEKDPALLPWEGADIVIESTGRFTDYESASRHKGKIIVISAPSPSENVRQFVRDVNCQSYNGERVIAGVSCTTVAASTVLKFLENNFGLSRAFITTIHSYTSSQSLVDGPHKDWRRARAAGLSIIPTTTGAARAVERITPELKGKIQAVAIRVPTPTVSLLDVVAELKTETSREEINEKFPYKSEAPLVSVDFKGDTRPAILDPDLTSVLGNLVKVLAWYDNEYGYSANLVRLLESVSDKL